MTFNNIIRIIHDKVPSYISFLILLKYHFTNNCFFHLLSYFLRFNAIIILCSNFSLKLHQINNKSLPYYLRYLTSYKLMEISAMSNLTYIIISFIIFFLFCFRMVCYIIIIKKIKHRQCTEELSLTLYKILLFFEHAAFLLYPFILEFLVQIIFSYIFPDNFLFEKDMPKILNLIVSIINVILILGYNINNYFFMIIINRPYDIHYTSIKFRYSNRKFWIIFLMQNTSLVQNIQLYFNKDEQVEIFSYIYLCFFCLLFLILFLISLKKYNYNNIVNSFLSIMASFCFFSIIIKCICLLFDYSFKTTLSIVSMNVFKLIVAIYFNYLMIFIGNSLLFRSAIKELFKINKELTKNRVYDSFWYIMEILKKVKNNQKDTSTVMLLNSIFKHQNKCTSSVCKCKLIQIIPHGKQYDENFTRNLIDRIGFLIESSFIQLDFSENCELALILSEHFFFFRDNPIMAYSFAQTLLIYNMDNFSIRNFLDSYEVSQKYIEAMTDLKYRIKTMRKNKKANEDKIAHDNLLETNFKETFLIYEKIQKIQEIMSDYCQVIINVIKKRNIVEESVKFKKFEDTGEIISIDFTYLNAKQMEEIIKMLYYETNLNKDLIKEMGGLKTSKFPMEFYYKIFLFWDSFMEGKIDEKFIPTFYSFTRDHNLYSTNINPNIFLLLRQRYIDLNKNNNNLYYCIFKYSKGLTISYFCEPLAQLLGYLQSELIDNDIEILMPNDIAKAHNNLLMHYLIIKQNRVYEGIKNKFFNKKGLLYDGSMNGAALLGLGKNLLVIITTSLTAKENEYDLYYNQNLELISFSNNFGKDFFMDLDLIAKCNMNLLALFGINQELIKKKLSDIKLNMIDYKYFLEIMTEEIYSKKLYKSTNKYNSVKYKLFDEIESQNFEESENYHINNKLLKTQKCLEHIYNNKFKDKINSLKLKFKRKKSLVLNNFDKFVNNNDKIDFNDKYYKSLLESFHLLQSNNNQNTTLGDASNIYSIDVDMHILYDIPLITIKIREIYDISLDKIEEIEKPLTKNKSNIILNLTKRDSKNITFDMPNKQDSISHLTKLTYNDSISSIGLPANLRMTSFEEKIKSGKGFFERYIKEIVVICILCVLVVYVSILIYQLNVIENIFNIFLAFYYNYIQRDKLVNLETAIISGYFYFTGLENYSEYISIKEYREFTKNMAEEYSDSYHTFYQNYIKYRFAFGRDLSPFYINYNFSRIQVSWKEITTLDNYIEEAEILIYLSILSTLADSKEAIIEDAQLFFNSSFRRADSLKKINTVYAQMLYYLCKNVQDNYITFFAYIQDEINDTQQSYSKSSRILSTAIEVLGYLLDVITLGSCIYFLKNSNNILYKSIINLFIDYTQEGNYSFKNSYDNFLVSEKLTRLKFVLNNFSIKAIDKYNKRISYGTIMNKNDLGDNDNTNNSFQNKPSGSFNKQQELSSKERKSKINKGITPMNKNDSNSNINKTNNNSLTISKSQNKLINSLSVNLISKLNQNITPEKPNINVSTKNNLNGDVSTQNLNTKIKNNELDEENSLTIDKIFEKLKILEINTVRFFTYLCICLILVLLIYSFIKLFEAFEYFKKTNSLFVDYSIVTFEYSLIMNYFNNLNILLINRPIGRMDFMADMQNRVEEQFKKSEEVKKKSLKNYPKVSKLFEILNNQNNDKQIKEILCKEDQYCIQIFDSDYNMAKKGIDVGLKTIAQEIYNTFRDFEQLKDEIYSLEDIKNNFMTENFAQVDLSLNFLLYEVEDRCAEVFLEEANDLIKSFKTVIISLNVFIIVFLTIISISLIFLIINRITILLKLIKKSTMRISMSINVIKEKCSGNKTKSASVL